MNTLDKDPIWEAAVKWNELDLPNPVDTESPEDESDVHLKYRTLIGEI